MLKEYYLSILYGQQRGFIAALIKSTLSAFTYPYLAVLNTRNLFYKNGVVESTRLPVRVISIGNITTGGTGKTPLVEFLARHLLEKKKKVAILSRGYGGNNPLQKSNDNVNDECLILMENLRNVPVLAGKNRVINGERAIRDYDVDCLVLDDGFQHLKLKRDLDIVVIDSLDPFGGENLIPRGSLREPLKPWTRGPVYNIALQSIQGKDYKINIHKIKPCK